jgi:chemotaxis signal transduction protein
MRDPRVGDEFGPAQTPAWVTRLRQAAVASYPSKASLAEADLADMLHLAGAVAPEEPAWAQEVAQSVAARLQDEAEAAIEEPTDEPVVTPSIETAARYTICQAGSQRVAIAVDHVLEVRPGRRYAALPGMAAFVRGVANVQGEAIPVLELAGLLGVEGEGNPNWERLLLVKPPGQGQTVGIVVDRVLDLNLLTGVGQTDGEVEGELAGYLTEVCEFEGEPVRVLDVGGLLRSGAIEMLAQTRRKNR